MEEYLVQLIPGLSSVEEDHPARMDAEAELLADLRQIAPSALASQHAEATSGNKGLIQDLILNVGGSGAAGGLAVRAFRIWLERDRRRSLKVIRKAADGRVLGETEISGEGISSETLNTALTKIDWPS